MALAEVDGEDWIVDSNYDVVIPHGIDWVWHDESEAEDYYQSVATEFIEYKGRIALTPVSSVETFVPKEERTLCRIEMASYVLKWVLPVVFCLPYVYVTYM
ncbi:hypothetical protein BRC64_05890 [Halobacteriales archaeon QH_10_67_22]|nr:MAG: hypothetical protein BRC64_05890 [Halobacteriales archaeon QH_10_67_22]